MLFIVVDCSFKPELYSFSNASPIDAVVIEAMRYNCLHISFYIQVSIS
jgi:hypothetical protein